jgi:DNA-binding GntR family transcriptional regulator
MATILPLRPEPAPTKRRGTKPATVAARIREMIIQDQLPPGTPIRERALAETLQVSRTPLREALKILATEGLVEQEPRRGAVVAAPSAREIRELLQVLGALEAFAAELACAAMEETELSELQALHYEMLAAHKRGDKLGYFHRNQDIHRGIVAATGNATLITYHGMINARVHRARYICNLRTQRWGAAIEEHERILEALGRRDGAAAAALLREHVLRGWDLMEQLEAGAAGAHPAATTAPAPTSASVSASE